MTYQNDFTLPSEIMTGVARQQYINQRLAETWQQEQAAIQKEYWAQQAENARMGTKMAVIDAADEAAWDKSQAVLAERALAAEHDKRMADKMAAIEAADEAVWNKSQAALAQRQDGSYDAVERLRAENIAKAAQNSSYNEVFSLSAAVAASDQAGTSWLASIPLIGPPLDNAWQNSTLKQVWNNNIAPIIKPNVLKNVSTGLLAATLLINPIVNAVEWGGNLLSNPGVFSDANENINTQLQGFFENHPEFANHPKDENFFNYVWNNPSQAVGAFADIGKGLTNIVAGYVDDWWQQNPFVQGAAPVLRGIGDAFCSKTDSQALGNLCYGAFYVDAAILEQPYDSLAGIANSLVIDPLAGLGKLAIFEIQNNPPKIIGELIGTALTEGWDEVKDYSFDKLAEAWNVATDPQVDSLAILAALILLTIANPLIGGGTILGMAGKGLIDVGSTLAQLPGVNDVIEFVNRQDVRSTVLGSLLVIFMTMAGASVQVKEMNAIRKTLSPANQAAYDGLSIFERVNLTNLAKAMKAPPEAVNFYLEQIAKGDSPLARLPLTDALRISTLAELSGKGAFLLDYVAKYGYTDALKIASPDVIKGMTSDQFLVQAQDILSNDAGFNVTPESVFTDYPGSTIGLKSTFITNEAAITKVIGDFHGTKTIYITYDQAVSLETALGLESGTLVDGLRISKISNLGSMDLTYPLKANNPLFRGPGQGLPGGGTEITINPPIPMDGPNVVDQIIIKVYP